MPRGSENQSAPAVRSGLALGLCLLTALSAAAAERLTLNFNPDWRFTRSDPAGAAAPGFDDRGWTAVSTPHTYNDTDTFDHWSTPGHRGEQLQWGGRTWYRKTFRVPEAWRGRLVLIEFEAARQVAEVTLNGHYLGVSKTGFTPFGFDLTPDLHYGADNVLAVMCDNRFSMDPPGPSPNLAQISRDFNELIPDRMDQLTAAEIPWNNPHWHPAHGGLYRDVRLFVTDRLHFTLPLPSFLGTVGPYVYATDISARAATVAVELPIANERPASESVRAQVELRDADGRTVMEAQGEKTLAAGELATLTLAGRVDSPRFWEPGYPHLYRAVCTLWQNHEIIDRTEVPFGIRAAQWDVARGFFLNGQPVKLHGWGQKPTDEWPGLGAAQPDWLHFFTLRLMQQAGGNFVRWGHCAAGPAQIGAADRLGLVIDQPGVDGESDTVRAAWKLRVSAFRDTLVYFRNHPSILIWEGGNQKVTGEHARELRAIMDRYDPHGGRAFAHRRPDEATAAVMDVVIGTEGGREIAHLPVVEGEYDREESPRRVWDDASPPNFGYPEARGQVYQLTSEQYAVDQIAQYLDKIGAPDQCGGANWIFSDSTSGGRVAVEVARTSGEVDGVRLPKEAYYVCSVLFRPEPQVHIIGHWTYPAGTRKTVFVAANAQKVELFINGRSLGFGRVSHRYLFTFPEVVWAPGEIRAVASTDGKVVATQSLRTAGPAVALRMTAQTGSAGLRADGSDVALIDVEAVDAQGARCPTFQRRVDFSLTGPGIWRGGYNSGKIDSINHPYLDLECGINRISVRATRRTGTIEVRARCDNLADAQVAIRAVDFPAPGGWTSVPPGAPAGELPPHAPAHASWREPPPAAPPSEAAAPAMAGRFIRTFAYSGPAASIVHVETRARTGANAYCDIDSPLPELPPELAGADWVQAANRDSAYPAEDLMQLALTGPADIFVAHDERTPPPGWLRRAFAPTDLGLTVAGHPLAIYRRHHIQAESLTLGSNRDDAARTDSAMYLVFVNRPAPAAIAAVRPLQWSVRLARSQMQREEGRLNFGAPGAKWDYSPAVFLLALCRLGERTGDPAYTRYAQAVVDSYLTPEGDIRTYRREDFSQDQVNPGKIVLALYAQTKTEPYRRAAERLRRQLAGQPRNQAGGFWHKARYPDQMWLDGLYMAEPFLAQYGELFSEPADFDEVVKQFRIIADHTYNPASGLFFHGWDESRRMGWADKATGQAPSYWSRGLGWYAMGLVDCLDYFPPSHPGRAEMIALLRRVADGIVRYQDPASGVWYQVTDQGPRSGNYLEASGSAMFVYALAKGVNHHYLGAEYLPAARRGFDGLVRQFIRENADGTVSLLLNNQSSGLAHHEDGTYEYYLRQPIVADDPKGVGPFILAGAEVDRLTPAPPALGRSVIKHDFIAIDEGRGNLLRVDENDPARNWRVPIGHPHPRDLQLIGQGQILISHDQGMAVYDLADGRRKSDLAAYANVSAARRLANGDTLLACVDTSPAPAVKVIELNPQNRVVATTLYPGDYVRLMRQTSGHTFLFGMNDRIKEGDDRGNFIWSAAVPGFRHAWKAVRLRNGDTLASAGYGAFMVELDPAGKLVRKFGTAAEVPAQIHPFFYADFQVLPSGDIVVANWQGHGPGHGNDGVQLLEFDPQGKIVWHWQDARLVSSLQAVLVLDGLDPSRLYDERDGVMEPLAPLTP